MIPSSSATSALGVDSKTKDLLAYYQRCIQSGNVDINVGFISA